MEPNDMLLESAPAELSAAMRELDGMAGALAARSQQLLALHIASKGWSSATHSISYDVQSGMFTLTPKQAA